MERDRVVELMRKAEIGINKLEHEKEMLSNELRDSHMSMEEMRVGLLDENHHIREPNPNPNWRR